MSGRKTKRKGYWKAYDKRFKIFNIKYTYDFVSFIINILLPYKEKRKVGRPLAISYNEYIATLIIKHIFRISLRDLETLSDYLHKKHIDSSTYGKAFQRIKISDLTKIIVGLHLIIANSLKSSVIIYIADSTGVHLLRVYCERIRVVNNEIKKVKYRVFDKMHVLACYYKDYGLISIVMVKWDNGYSSDSKNLLKMIKSLDFVKGAIILLDGGYDDEDLLRELLSIDLIPIVKTKEFKWDYGISKIRKKVKKLFDKKLYKIRGVIEAIFGGLKTKFRLTLNEKLPESRCRATLAVAIVHNILTLMRVISIRE
ncbi:transposase [Methanotorris igneus]|uniref:Transposase IS4 family protein n=1 Tax=Methanotorris igneus (strain DSM 5666 / JCM 11834 / Kol 5) TaxID=880724 RepID=F6BF34_METIK|nr:transposase [Methanotorris igneus]AEF95867.1 transposase IS4 family protein [Methanotorris igneus Kol 5]AEF96020.1 transposase IS4 family protein [Methanotorris igneus Kol 5]AEF96087.1 transposase IS4 family protein [Methanotorris igneus Kol 5]AEF96154.1 transposase IS4 family protein [Methanotorris igneus Kol 5]AEF96197.1 transposase IS4 family protein [Methanotorris igneus Kol 5]